MCGGVWWGVCGVMCMVWCGVVWCGDPSQISLTSFFKLVYTPTRSVRTALTPQLIATLISSSLLTVQTQTSLPASLQSLKNCWPSWPINRGKQIENP